MFCPVCAAVATAFMRVDARDYWRCPRCAAVFLAPAQRLSPKAEAAHYRLHHNDPDDVAYRQFLDRLAQPLLARMTGFRPEADAFAKWHYRRDPTHVVFYAQATFRIIAQQWGWQCAFPARNVVLMRKPFA